MPEFSSGLPSEERLILPDGEMQRVDLVEEQKFEKGTKRKTLRESCD